MANCTCNTFPASLGNVTFAEKVGIGTTSPVATLDISASTPNIRLSGSNPALNLNNTDASAVTSTLSQFDNRLELALPGGNYLSLATAVAGTEEMRFDPTSSSFINGGSLGIGTSTPEAALDVRGTIFADNGSDAAPSYAFSSNSNTGMFLLATNKLQFTANGQDPLTIDGSSGAGRVGLNAASPANLLDVAGGMVIGSSYAGGETAPTNGLLVQGPVGIGTTTPLTLLQLGLAGTTPGTLSLAGAASGLVTLTTQAEAGTYTLTLPNGTGSSGQVLATDGAGGLSWQDGGSPSPWVTAGSAIFYSVGNVGIGTTSPAYPLDVSGAARISGGLELGALLSCPGVALVGTSGNSLQVGYDTTGTQAQMQAEQTGVGPQTLALNPAGGSVGLSQASAPAQPQLALQSGGGLTPDQAYSYVLTAVDATGAESPLSPEATATTTDTEQAILVSWPAVPWASSYNLYRGTAAGGENSVVSVPAPPTSGSPLLVSYLDSTATWPTGTLPTFAAFLAQALPSTGAVLVNGVLAVGALPPPSGITATPTSGTGGLALGTYSYVLTSLDGAGGESLPSAAVTVDITDAGTSYVLLAWAQLEAVGSYNVYRTPSGGTTQQFPVSGLSFTDQGQTGTAVSPPSVSTAYAARLDATGLYIGGKKIADASGSYYA